MRGYSTRFTGFFISCLLLAGCSGGGNPPAMAPIPPMPLGRHDSRIVGFAYVPNYLGKNVSGYAIKADGSLAQLAGSPFEAGGTPWGVAIDPKGKFVYVTDLTFDVVYAYTIDARSGALTPVAGSPFATGRRSLLRGSGS